MVPAARHRGEGDVVTFALVFHCRTAFGNGELRRAVDTGRGGLDKVRVREVVFFQTPEEVARRLEVVVLGVVRALAVDLGVGRGGLGSSVDYRFWLVDREEFVYERFVRKVALDEREIRDLVGLFGCVEACFDGFDWGG